MAPTAKSVLEQFKIANNLYVLGSFEKGLTIYSQQVRALNLVWAMIEAAPKEALQRVAVIGGGFAGLTAAAGFLLKGAQCVFVFEKRGALCPLQEGSDTRWVHPRIYDWPNEGSTSPAAALPLLNWNAGRASDVVVEVLQEWENITRPLETSTGSSVKSPIQTYVNVKHLRVDKNLNIEWVGENLTSFSRTAPSGFKEAFGSVILAVGFGIEPDAKIPYWRNETLGQPRLDLGVRTYLVSGHGDGALVDLFRVRIARFRQDRILVELFEGNAALKSELSKIKANYDRNPGNLDLLFDEFEALATNKSSGFEDLLTALRMRLRTDTAAILQMSPTIDSFRQIFRSLASFQNRFLVFALYRAGGVIPTREECTEKLLKEHGIDAGDVIYRHGIKKSAEKAVEDVLDRELKDACAKEVDKLKNNVGQPANICWTGGYWHQQSDKLSGKVAADEATKAGWRLEHLPAATELLVTGFISAVSGYLSAIGSVGADFRITLHRTLYVGEEPWLQQAAKYVGNTSRLGKAARTFGFNHASVGYAAVARQIVCTRSKDISETDAQYAEALQQDTEQLKVTADSQRMNPNVRSVLAIPILTPDKNRTLAVLYADSTTVNAFEESCITTLVEMCKSFASEIGDIDFSRVGNFQVPPTVSIPEMDGGAIARLQVMKALESPSPPSAKNASYLNVEFTDFIVHGKN
jgi:hypothetical protein